MPTKAPSPLLTIRDRRNAPRRTFTDTALSLSLTLLNSLIDLVSFSGILYSIYPPLFAALLLYSIGGTAASVALGRVRALGGVGVGGWGWLLGEVIGPRAGRIITHAAWKLDAC
jgi:ABC-type uncharacterized transport system fused permease/ATPase subunit